MNHEWAFDMAEEAASRAYQKGQSDLKGEIRGLLIRLRSGNITQESFVERVDEKTK